MGQGIGPVNQKLGGHTRHTHLMVVRSQPVGILELHVALLGFATERSGADGGPSAVFTYPWSIPTANTEGMCLSDATLRFDLALGARRQHAPRGC